MIWPQNWRAVKQLIQAQITAQRWLICVMVVAWWNLQASGQTAHTYGHPHDVHIRYHHRPDDSTRLEGPFEASCAGSAWLEGHFKDGRKHGEWVTYHLETGLPLARGAFTAGRPTGSWTFSHPDGRPRAEGRFDTAGEHAGVWTSYHAGVGDGRRVWAEWGETHLHVLSPTGDTLLSRRLVGEDRMAERTFAAGGRLLREVAYKWVAGEKMTAPRQRLLVPPSDEQLFIGMEIARRSEGRWMPWGSMRRYSVHGVLIEHLVWRGDTLLQVVASRNAFGEVPEEPRTAWDASRGDGVLIRRFSDGRVAMTAEYEDNLRHGAFTKHLPNGRVLVTGQFEHGEAAGKWHVNEITGRLAMTAAVASDGCWVGQEWSLSGRQTAQFRVCNGWADGAQVTFDAYGDTAEVSTWAMGLLSGPFQAYRRGALFLQGVFSDQTRSTTWLTFNPWGQITHESTYADAPDNWDRRAWPPPQGRPGPALSLTAGQDEGPAGAIWPWSWRASARPAAGFDTNTELLAPQVGTAWELVWGEGLGAAGYIVEWDVTGHVTGFKSLFSERQDLREMGAMGIQRMLVVRPETRFGFPAAGAEVIVLRQQNQVP